MNQILFCVMNYSIFYIIIIKKYFIRKEEGGARLLLH